MNSKVVGIFFLSSWNWIGKKVGQKRREIMYVMKVKNKHFTRIKMSIWGNIFIDILTKNIFLPTCNLKIVAYLLLSLSSPRILLPFPPAKTEKSGNQLSNLFRNLIVFYELFPSFCIIFLSNSSTFYFSYNFHLKNQNNFEE